MAKREKGYHQLLAEDLDKPEQLRRHLCLDHRGTGATALTCQMCEVPCGYGKRYLELLGLPCTGTQAANKGQQMTAAEQCKRLLGRHKGYRLAEREV